MRFRIVILVCSVFALAISAVAQTKVVTNADLEKYRVARLEADREYRENYERLGMPSPEELERRRERSAIELRELSAKLRAAELEHERLEIQRQTIVSASGDIESQRFYDSAAYVPGVIFSYGTFRRRGHGNRFQPNYFPQSGYIGGGQFWPTGPRTPPQPLFKYVRRPR